MIIFNPTNGGGLLIQTAFLALFCDPIDPKKFDFSQISMTMPPILFRGIKYAKIRIWKCGFLAFFWAKMAKIVIQNLKLIVTNDYQQFQAHFEWFLSLFQISDEKYELSLVAIKVHKNGIFWAKILFLKKFPRLFLSPNPSYMKKLGQNGL